MNMIFSQSPDMKKEYCCTVVRIGEILPIEGKDVIGQTLVNGFPVVVRKDQVHEGDLMFYAKMECQLHAEFCWANNLYDNPEMNHDKTQKGYFNKYGRVRIVRLGGVPSMGYLFTAQEMLNFMTSVGIYGGFTMEELLDVEFDTVGDRLFVKPFVPSIKESTPAGQGRGTKRNKRLLKFDRMIPGEFAFHYDTNQFNDNVRQFSPNDQVSITVKLHGCSAIIGNIRVREPKYKSGLFGKLYTGLFGYLPKFLQFVVKKFDYVYSTRSVIINQDINPHDTGRGYAGGLVQREVERYGEMFKKYNVLPEGTTIYGEVVGYYTGTSIPIQKTCDAYDYGCDHGENKLMIYRIVSEDPYGDKYEWDVPEIQSWTEHVKDIHPEIAKNIHTIDVLYVGALRDLYPDLDTEKHWHQNLLARMKNESRWYMEQNEPMCKHAVPREGIVIRKINDPIKEAFKLKTLKFSFKEAEKIDKGEVDIETKQGYTE